MTGISYVVLCSIYQKRRSLIICRQTDISLPRSSRTPSGIDKRIKQQSIVQNVRQTHTCTSYPGSRVKTNFIQQQRFENSGSVTAAKRAPPRQLSPWAKRPPSPSSSQPPRLSIAVAVLILLNAGALLGSALTAKSMSRFPLLSRSQYTRRQSTSDKRTSRGSLWMPYQSMVVPGSLPAGAALIRWVSVLLLVSV